MAARVDRLDRLQQRHRAISFPLGVVYKFFDDQGNYLAVIVTYYAFIAVFPLLLIASSVLGFVLQGDATLRNEVLTSALGQFPIVGDQLGRPEGLQGSASAVVIGGLAALYGVQGLGQAAQNTVNVVWAVPRNSRLNPVVSRLRSFLLLMLAGLTVLLVAVLSSVASHLDILGGNFNQGVRLAVGGSAVLLNALVLAVMMRLATTQRQGFWAALPGALTVAVLWQGLQLVGGAYVGHVVSRASAMNGVFALVLGLVALIYLAAVIAVLGLEINVVLAKRLYPRALLSPFTDAVQLTEADRRVYTENAQAQRLKGFEHVQVSFDADGAVAPIEGSEHVHVGSDDADAP
jgi:membrane protein